MPEREGAEASPCPKSFRNTFLRVQWSALNLSILLLQPNIFVDLVVQSVCVADSPNGSKWPLRRSLTSICVVAPSCQTLGYRNRSLRLLYDFT